LSSTTRALAQLPSRHLASTRRSVAVALAPALVQRLNTPAGRSSRLRIVTNTSALWLVTGSFARPPRPTDNIAAAAARTSQQSLDLDHFHLFLYRAEKKVPTDQSQSTTSTAALASTSTSTSKIDLATYVALP
jgi:hypothetical protein